LLKATETLVTEALALDKSKDAAVWKEWRTCIMIGYFTGVRLGDAIAMTLGHFDLEKHFMKVRPQKTSRKKRDLIIPLHPQLEAHILDLPIADASGPLCPNLAQRKVSGKYGLSIQFHKIIGKTQIQQETVKALGDAGHKFNRYTFHSLRHSYISELANAGIAPDVRQLLSGHADEKTHAVYTHTKLETLRQAIKVLPRIG
jgi:integrase